MLAAAVRCVLPRNCFAELCLFVLLRLSGFMVSEVQFVGREFVNQVGNVLRFLLVKVLNFVVVGRGNGAVRALEKVVQCLRDQLAFVDVKLRGTCGGGHVCFLG